jgi:hypothetical protein
MSVLTPANQLTLARVLLAPAFVILTVYGYFGWALIVFAIAGLTDLLDGLIARTFSRRTSLGAWLDPMADKHAARARSREQAAGVADDSDHYEGSADRPDRRGHQSCDRPP